MCMRAHGKLMTFEHVWNVRQESSRVTRLAVTRYNIAPHVPYLLDAYITIVYIFRVISSP